MFTIVTQFTFAKSSELRPPNKVKYVTNTMTVIRTGQQNGEVLELTDAAEILHPTTAWCCRNSASHHWLVPQKFYIPPLTGAAEILHPTTDWCCRNSASHHWLVPQRFCNPPLTGAAEILHPITHWYPHQTKGVVPQQFIHSLYGLMGKTYRLSQKFTAMRAKVLITVIKK